MIRSFLPSTLLSRKGLLAAMTATWSSRRDRSAILSDVWILRTIKRWDLEHSHVRRNAPESTITDTARQVAKPYVTALRFFPRPEDTGLAASCAAGAARDEDDKQG